MKERRGGWRILHNEVTHNLLSTPQSTLAIKSRMRLICLNVQAC